MIKESQTFFEKQDLVQRLLNDYRNIIVGKLKISGYYLIEDKNNYMLLRAKRNSSISEILRCKIYYARSH